MKPATASDLKRRELAQIHIAKKQLLMEDDAYRAVLWSVARVRSSKDLDWTGRKRVLDHLKKCGANLGFKGKPKPQPLSKDDLVKKVEAQLADMTLPWAYAHGMAKRMFQLERLEFCDPRQIHKIVAALAYKQKKLHKERLAAERLKEAQGHA